MRSLRSLISALALLTTPAFCQAKDGAQELWSSRIPFSGSYQRDDLTHAEIQPATLESSTSFTQFSWGHPNAETLIPANVQATISQAPAGANHIDALLVSPAPVHGFWDRENDLLFAAVGASRALDYASTLNFRRRGRNEALLTNDIVDNHAAFAAIEVGTTALSIGVSYLFHHYHHHRLERWTSIIHAGLATSGAIRNYCLESVPTSASP